MQVLNLDAVESKESNTLVYSSDGEEMKFTVYSPTP